MQGTGKTSQQEKALATYPDNLCFIPGTRMTEEEHACLRVVLMSTQMTRHLHVHIHTCMHMCMHTYTHTGSKYNFHIYF